MVKSSSIIKSSGYIGVECEGNIEPPKGGRCIMKRRPALNSNPKRELGDNHV